MVLLFLIHSQHKKEIYTSLLWYFIFCFTYIINSDATENSIPRVNEMSNSRGIKKTPELLNSPKIKNKKIDNVNIEKLDISKPVVSFNPKPIIIDTNLNDQLDKEKKIVKDSVPEPIIPKLSNEDKGRLTESLRLNEVMICRGVYKRNPIKPGFTFPNNVDSLFCYTKISNKGTKQEVKHLWYYENKLITTVTYNIKTSYNYRSWSKKTILPSQIGQWRVDIIDNKNTVLGSRKFEISSLNNSF